MLRELETTETSGLQLENHNDYNKNDNISNHSHNNNKHNNNDNNHRIDNSNNHDNDETLKTKFPTTTVTRMIPTTLNSDSKENNRKIQKTAVVAIRPLASASLALKGPRQGPV